MKNRGKPAILLGLLLLAAALFLTGYNMYDSYRAEQSATEAKAKLEKLIPEPETILPPPLPGEETEPPAFDEIEIPDYILNPEMDLPSVEVDGVDYIGTISMPTINLELPVIKNLTTANLKLAPCRYYGTSYSGSLVIAGHNYLTHFGPISRLKQDDEVIFTDIDGNVFKYAVVDKETLAADEVEEMISDEYDLTLFTCTLDGASRITIRCERVEEETE